MPARSASHRLRIGRYAEQNRIYLLTANTRMREPVFQDYGLGRIVIHHFKEVQRQGCVDSLAFVVMPDHFHWLIQLRRESLGPLMCRMKSLSARDVNEAAGRTGNLWQQGYHDRALRREDDLIKLARYVVANPLRAGLVERLGDYPLWDAIWV